MAEPAVSALVKTIVQKIGNEALSAYALSLGIKTELDKVEDKLSLIQPLLIDASAKEIRSEGVKKWLNHLQHLAYDIDDVLDDANTEAMHLDLIQSNSVFNKVRKFILTCCTNFSQSRRLRHRLDSINAKLDHLYQAISALGFIEKHENKTKKDENKDINRGKETSLLEANVVGREGVKEKLIKELLGGESSKINFSIVSIVGMGGVGKTTLARLLYNDTRVKNHFELMVWVCVSIDFDIFKITKIIFLAVSEVNNEFEDLNQLQMSLQEKLKGKRFLLVLDDVWNESSNAWENLEKPFHSSAPGSKIIMTTRKAQLLKELGFNHIERLESLTHEDALSLVSLHALGVDNFDSHPTFKSLGEGIVKKCGCLPLALKAVGRLLRTKKEEDYWDDMLNSEIWSLKIVDGILPALMLSYHDLSADLKCLFAYCSLFPKDFLFDKEEMVLLWMAEGYLEQESLGRGSFDELELRSFFQRAPNDISFFVMHDLMNDLARFVAKDFSLMFDKHVQMPDEALANYRHMSFIRENYTPYQRFKAFKRANSLRTFLAVSVEVNQSWNHLSSKILVDVIFRLPLLRVLSLSRFRIREIPDFIGSLKHLRHLNFSLTEITELPEDVSNLYNLQTLILFGCKSLAKLPKSFIQLKKLRHLDISDTPLLNKLPFGIGGLTSIQTLTKFIVGGDVGFAITELNKLKNLHGKICIKGLYNVQDATHAREANLSLKGITELELDWVNNSQDYTLEEEVFKELKPYSKMLKMLRVKCYGGINFPEWVGDPSFNLLVRVSLSDCRNCTSLPTLGQLPSLRELFIKGMAKVEVIDFELTSATIVAFPSLEILEFHDMLCWREWSFNNEVSDVFPCLRKLRIKNCPNLISVSLKALCTLGGFTTRK
ncbi:hypothetical protein QVD17_28357 [Tagetes erecta]|uniref:NB-ARC n=1 Tax=Tagetes erecta TaxID=13708 RepID=A0AAD8KA78_TARER|nr:hypothetical protein QVD17_28357 [Tagetes erecta]